ncbi:conserved hypothetical protein [Segniliparus rotundus DSM 44985]|uniref:Uncharacterized protein n=1 Tax=Segniliparus rotundus (strain ATCC BAA-972 / CDC 1076 / CIP 108378 / DSM 44985 / JCM 13578) TaxID=640132 RepID=D6ZDY7_SEGRD|nr:hypothetical protein [Segniliparus rotundus]ADG97267.1 conserved hypothetical protein [Segniliparus rotundus DSM 44985]
MTVKSTIQFSDRQHDALAVWQREAARKLGRARVTRQEVVVALVGKLLSDKKLSEEILASL